MITYTTPFKIHTRIVEGIGFFPKARTPEAVGSYWARRAEFCARRIEFCASVVVSADDLGMPITGVVADVVAEANAFGAEYWHALRMKDRAAH